jgi:hypothetical protein
MTPELVIRVSSFTTMRSKKDVMSARLHAMLPPFLAALCSVVLACSSSATPGAADTANMRSRGGNGDGSVGRGSPDAPAPDRASPNDGRPPARDAAQEASADARTYPLIGAYPIDPSDEVAQAATIAKFNLVILQNYPSFGQGGHDTTESLAAIKAMNPDITLIIYSDVMELTYDADDVGQAHHGQRRRLVLQRRHRGGILGNHPRVLGPLGWRSSRENVLDVHRRSRLGLFHEFHRASPRQLHFEAHEHRFVQR